MLGVWGCNVRGLRYLPTPRARPRAVDLQPKGIEWEQSSTRELNGSKAAENNGGKQWVQQQEAAAAAAAAAAAVPAVIASASLTAHPSIKPLNITNKPQTINKQTLHHQPTNPTHATAKPHRIFCTGRAKMPATMPATARDNTF